MSKRSRDRDEYDSVDRVRVFINHMDFALAWQFEHYKLIRKTLTPGDKLNALSESMTIKWELLPSAILEQLKIMDYIGETPKELRAVDIYSSAERKDDGAKADFETWLDEELDPLPGFQVHPFLRKKENRKTCASCEKPLILTELIKGLNTKVACDLLSYAVNDAYDIAVLIMDDDEIVPSVLGVQEIFDKKIIHVGARGVGDALRSAAWGNFFVDNLVSELVSADDYRKRLRT